MRSFCAAHSPRLRLQLIAEIHFSPESPVGRSSCSVAHALVTPEFRAPPGMCYFYDPGRTGRELAKRCNSGQSFHSDVCPRDGTSASAGSLLGIHVLRLHLQAHGSGGVTSCPDASWAPQVCGAALISILATFNELFPMEAFPWKPRAPPPLPVLRPLGLSPHTPAFSPSADSGPGPAQCRCCASLYRLTWILVRASCVRGLIRSMCSQTFRMKEWILATKAVSSILCSSPQTLKYIHKNQLSIIFVSKVMNKQCQMEPMLLLLK